VSHKTENQMLIVKEVTESAPSSPEFLKTYFLEVFCFSLAQQPLVGHGLLNVEASR
jgi:hypothetical protein